MLITVNGEERQSPDGASVEDLLRDMGVNPERVAVLVNDRVVARSDRASVKLKHADRVEILVFAGGG
jgi:thiamine biosynthesis protein ThiS